MDVTNNSKAPQGIHTLDGVVYVQPGETKPVRLNKTLESHAKGLDFFELDGEAEEDELGKADTGNGTLVTNDQMDALKTKFEEQQAEIGRLTSENADLTKAASDRDADLEKLKAQLSEKDSELAKLKGDGLDRDDLKKQAKELGIDHAPNISNAKLKELIDAKLAS